MKSHTLFEAFLRASAMIPTFILCFGLLAGIAGFDVFRPYYYIMLPAFGLVSLYVTLWFDLEIEELLR